MQFPRYLHRSDLATRYVANEDACQAALAEGWSVAPVPVVLTRGGHTVTVYTADARAVALKDGWAVVDPVAEPVAPPKKARK